MSLLDGINRSPPGTPEGTADLALELRRSLDQARPHQLGLAGCGGLAGSAVLLLALGVSGFLISQDATPENIGAAVGAGACYASLSLIYLVPAVALYRVAAALTEPGTAEQQVLNTVTRLRRFWQIAAAMLLGLILLYGLLFVVIIGLATIGQSLEQTFEEVATEVES